MISSEKRAALQKARAVVRELEKPEREAKRIKLAQDRAKRERRVGQTAEGQRKPRKQEPLYLAWIRRSCCLTCGKPGPSEAAHVRAGYAADGWRPTGMGEKPSDRRTVPLCGDCHREGPKAQHRAKERAWWEQHGLYPPTVCAALSAAYDANQDAIEVVRPRKTKETSR